MENISLIKVHPLYLKEKVMLQTCLQHKDLQVDFTWIFQFL